RGGDLDHRGHAAVAEGRHTGLPVHGRGDLGDDRVEVQRARGDDLTAGVGDQREGRVGGGERRREGGELLAGGGHVRRVEGPGDLQRDDAGLRRAVLSERGDLLGAAGGDDLGGGVDVRRVESVAL